MNVEKFKTVVQDHDIFKSLDNGDDSYRNPTHRPDQLIHVHDGCLYAWSNKDSCFYFTSLKSELSNNGSNIQKLVCSPPPLFDVKTVIFNSQCTLVALIGSRGASVVILPQKWKQNKEGDAVFCRCTPIGERFFTTCIMVQLHEAAWHPGSPSNSHLCLLASDNTLRIYDVNSDIQNPVQVHKLGHANIGSSRFSIISSSFSVSSAIGESVISFAFAPPVEVQEKRKKILQARKMNEPPTVTLYPAYLLQGNGDVLVILTSVSDSRYRKGLLHGPLTMQPAAEDNYGVDACSILVLDSNPTVIAIATAAGKIHHCIALALNYDSDDDEDLDTQSTTSWPASVVSINSKGLTSEFSPPMLFVYETVELEFVPEYESDDQDESEFENQSIVLHSDPLLYNRYHCCTKLGIHAIVLPWIDKLVAFLETENDDKNMLADLSQEQPCIVEHIVCTKPTSSSQACCIKGVTFATNPLFGPSLLCLTADNHCTVVPLLTIFKPLPPPLPSDEFDLASKGNDATILAETSDFDDHIRAILRRDTSQPLLRYDASSRETVMDSEASRLINRVTQILRKEYILKQKLAKDAILKQRDLLKQQKQQQLKDIEKLEQKKSELTDTAGEIAESFEDCVERQEILSKRLEEVLKHAQSKVTILSKAEIEMFKKLQLMSDKMKHLENKIKQIQAKHEYQKEKFGDNDGFDSGQQRRASADPTKVHKYKEILYEEGQRIEDLVKKLKRLKVLAESSS